MRVPVGRLFRERRPGVDGVGTVFVCGDGWRDVGSSEGVVGDGMVYMSSKLNGGGGKGGKAADGGFVSSPAPLKPRPSANRDAPPRSGKASASKIAGLVSISADMSAESSAGVVRKSSKGESSIGDVKNSLKSFAMRNSGDAERQE